MFGQFRVVVLGILFGCGILAVSAWTAETRDARSVERPQSNWQVVETASFKIYCQANRRLDPEFAAKCEALRSRLARDWFGDGADRPWEPKCDLVLHGQISGYRSAVGRLADCSVASCDVEVVGGAVVRRRIDLRVGSHSSLDALAHELTHLLIDSNLTAGRLPLWIDEGMALMADTAGKRAAHNRELRAALRSAKEFQMADLLGLAEYPGDGRMGILYGQSLSVVEFLVARAGRGKFVEFVRRAARDGYDAALKSNYDIRGVAELDRLWRSEIHRARAESAVVRVAGTSSFDSLGMAADRGLPGEISHAKR